MTKVVGRTPVKLYCPVRFDPEVHLAPDTRRFADHLIYLAHLVYYRKHTDRRYSHHGPVPIKAAYVREVVGKHLYPRVIRLAQEIGLIGFCCGRSAGRSCGGTGLHKKDASLSLGCYRS